MVFEKPLIDTRELMRALDPVSGRGEREFSRLRQARLLSTGVSIEDIRLAGQDQRLTLYCSLNRDAISAVRRGRTSTAREIRTHAERIERETLGPWLEMASESRARSEEPCADLDWEEAISDGWIDGMLFASRTGGETEVAEPVWRAAGEVAEIRSRYQAEDPNVRLTVGRVWTIDDALSEVRPEGPFADQSFVFPADEVLQAGLRLGDPVVIRHEEFAAGVFLTTIERGLDRSARTSRVSGQPLPRHLEELLDASGLSPRHRVVTRPLRRVA